MAKGSSSPPPSASPTASPTASPPEEFTVDELAQIAGLPTSTIRMYQNRGLLDPPEKRGRVGWYGSGHVARLELIADLKGRGFSLAGIKDLLESWKTGGSLDALLGVDQLAPRLQRPTSVRVPAKELHKALGQLSVTQKEIRRAQKVGAIKLDGLEFLVPNERFLDTGRTMSDMGLSLSEILDELEALIGHLEPVIARFRAVFDRHVWEDFVARGMPETEIPKLAQTVDTLAGVATEVVNAMMHDAFVQLADEYLASVDSDARFGSTSAEDHG